MVPIEAFLGGAEAHRRETGRPLVTLSYAQSLDGSIALHRGEPLGLSGPESLEMTHRLRAAHEAILVGVGTVLADDPRLTVRMVQGRNPQPVILDSRLRFPLEARLLHKPGLSPWIFITQEIDRERGRRLERAGARLYPLPADEEGRVPLDRVLDCLGELGISSLMVEGGARVITSFLKRGLADQVVLTITPRFVGGLRAVEARLGPWDTYLGEEPFPTLKHTGWARSGDDLIVWGSLKPAPKG